MGGPVGCATEQLVQRYDEARASSPDGSRAQHRKEWLDELAAAYEHFCHRAQTRIEHRERTFEFNSRAGRKSSRRLINPVVIRRQIKIKADVAGSRQAQKVPYENAVGPGATMARPTKAKKAKVSAAGMAGNPAAAAAYGAA